MIHLHLGVIDFPYGTSGVTTGDVAGFLERKYGVMYAFWLVHQEEILTDMEDAIAGQLENVLMGVPFTDEPFAGSNGKVEKRFQQFLYTREVENLGLTGVPTKAALDGVNHRLKSGKGPRRPSFIDTGLYENSFVAWVDEQEATEAVNL